jgi:predicted nucleotidyltransferase
MLSNSEFNLEVIRRISLALGEMNERVSFVGGATIGLYINDPAAEDVRATKDVDITVEIASLGELESIREELVQKGFTQSPEDDVICRFRFDNIKVDVMSTKEVGWAPANPWFSQGFAHRETVKIGDQMIQLLPLPYFIASKFAAYIGRGGKDPRTSHDFEDIVYVIDNRTDIVAQIDKAPMDVKHYLMEQLKIILNHNAMQEAILGNLAYETRDVRYGRIIESFEKIINLD